MEDKNLEQLISITFCVKIGESANEMLMLLTLAYENALRWNRMFLNAWAVQGRARRCARCPKKCAEKRKARKQMRTEYEPWYAQIEG
jgi:hypothetical protein